MLPADPSTKARIIVPGDEERLVDVANKAFRDEMYVIHNGSMVIVCSIILVGWKKLAIRDRDLAKRPKLRLTPALERHFPVAANDVGTEN
ncbi:MAG: hypothetical protein FD131_3255 [Rhodocyclaceae bacterium]|nr:MAG: hypothetical protein FD131_3255 [Rhodocyclaceae bacterium]